MDELRIPIPRDAPPCPNPGSPSFFDELFAKRIHMTESKVTDATPVSAVESMRRQAQSWARSVPIRLDSWSELLATLILTTFQMRPTTVSHWEEVQIVYAVVGGKRWRAHDGYLFTYCNGGWGKLEGATPSMILRETADALVSLEGFYLCCGENTGVPTPRTSQSLLRVLADLLSRGNGPLDLADKTVMEEGHFARNYPRRGRGPSGACDWAERQADFVASLRKKLFDELCSDGFRKAYVEWTDSPYRPAKPAIAFDDCFFGPSYASEEKSGDCNCYVLLRYPVLLPDPVLEAAAGKLKCFLSSCFYGNQPMLQLYFMLEALAVHSVNIKAMLFFQDDGNKGKSALTTLRASVWGQSHTVADPSIFFAPEEMRKQGIDLTHKWFVTIQETVENRKAVFLEHLWKKFCTQEAVAIRPNYAKSTKRVPFTGLKIWELNQVMRGVGCVYDTVVRRVICAHLMATFTGDPDAVNEADGVFLLDRGIDDFLRSGPCAAAYMACVFLPFLQRTSQAECVGALGNLKAYDNAHGSTIATDSERLAREMCGGQDDWADLIPPTAQPPLAAEGGPPTNEVGELPARQDTASLDFEGARVRDGIIQDGGKIFISRVGHCPKIPGVSATPRKRPRGGRIVVSRRAKMEMFVGRGFFRKVRNEYVPVIPAEKFEPRGPIGRLEGYVETPNLRALQDAATDPVSRKNLTATQRAWEALKRDKQAIAGRLIDADVTGHVEMLRRTTSFLEQYLRTVEDGGGQVAVKYEYKTPFGGRRYALGSFAAQVLPRDIREAMFRDTAVDVDMVNAFPSLLAQLASKLCGEEYARAMAPALFDYNACREEVLRRINSWMGGGRREAKDLVLRILNGGGVPSFFRTNSRSQIGNKPLLSTPGDARPSFLDDLKKAGCFCARLAEQAWPEMAGIFAERQRPDLTVLHYFVASIEDAVLAEAEKFLEQEGCRVNSLHFDGLLVQTGNRHLDDKLLGDMRCHVAKGTGYTVEFAVKDWAGGFFGRLGSMLTSRPETEAARFALRGNCVVVSAVAVVLSGRASPCEFAEACRLMEQQFVGNSGAREAATQRCVSVSYGFVSEQMRRLHKVNIVPALLSDLMPHLSRGGAALLHHGRHCVGLRYDNASRTVDVFDTARGSVGRTTTDQVFALLTDAPGAYCAQAFLCSPCGNDSIASPKYRPWQLAALELEASGTQEEEEADEETCNPTEDLLKSLTEEKNAFLRSARKPPGGANQYTCHLCPSRTFSRKAKLLTHVANYHNASHCAASSKQLRLCVSMHNTGQIDDAFCAILSDGVEQSPGGYLARSAAMMREWVCTSPTFRNIEGKTTCWGRYLSLVLTETGPRHLLKEDLRDGYTRCGNVYYAEAFADLVLAFTLSPETHGCQRRVYNGLIQHFTALGSETTFLMPRPHRNIRDIQMMIAEGGTSKKIVRRGLQYLKDAREFEVLAHDGTYKVAMGLIGQPGHGVRVRREDGQTGNAEDSRKAAKDKGDQHVVQTLRTKGGCTCGVAGSFSESAELVRSFVKESVHGDKESLSQVRMFFSDSSEKWTRPVCLRCCPICSV